MTPFTEKAINIIKNIPEGRVMTYGQIAKLAGSPGGARQVVRILHSMSSKYELPWHRVVNRKGEIVLRDDELFNEQLERLKEEGVETKGNGQINLFLYEWHP